MEEIVQILGSPRSERHFDLAERLPRIYRALPSSRDRERVLSAMEHMATSKEPMRTCESLASALGDFPGPARERLLRALEGDYCGPPHLRHSRDNWREGIERQEKVVGRRAEEVRAVLQQVAGAPPEGLSALERILAAQIEATSTRALGSAETMLVAGAVLERVRDVRRRVESGTTVAAAVTSSSQGMDLRRLDETENRQELWWSFDESRRREHQDWSRCKETTLTDAVRELRLLFADELRCFPRVSLTTWEPSWRWPAEDPVRTAAWRARITGYKRSLALALGSVVLNALEATEAEGVVRIEASLTESEPKRRFSVGRLTVEVTDDGCGVPPELQPFVLLPGQSTKEGRFGWGLALARRLIEHDCSGTIELESSPGRGTRVRIKLPTESD